MMMQSEWIGFISTVVMSKILSMFMNILSCCQQKRYVMLVIAVSGRKNIGAFTVAFLLV